ncbi:MAG: SLC13 family permease [Peptococcaceae bacterium]|jgi:anion transporter|nr:SLC13 family permease [Peptococcaceae bacterium]
MAVTDFTHHRGPTSSWKLALGSVLAVGITLALWFSHFAGVTPAGRHFMALLAMVIILWIFEVMPTGFAGLLFMTLVALLKIAPPQVAFSGFTAPVLWLIFAGLAIGAAADKTGLGKRMAYWTLVKLKATTPHKLLWSFLLVGAVMTPLLPTVFARLAVLIPVGVGLLSVFNITPGSRMAKFILISMFVGSQGVMLMFMTGLEPTLLAVGTLSHYSIHVYWSKYILMWILPSLVLNLGLNWAAAWLLFRPAREEYAGETLEVFRNEYSNLGPVSPAEKRLAGWFVLIILLWLTDFLTHLSPDWVGVFGAVGIFLPVVGVMKPKDLQERLNFIQVIFFASALSISSILTRIHLDKWFSGLLAEHLAINNTGVFSSFILGGLVQVLHVPLSTVSSTVAALAPIIVAYAAHHGLNLAWAAWIVVASAAPYIFPYQSAPLLMTYGIGHLTMGDMIKLGVFVSVGTLIAVPLLDVLWWSWTIPLAIK